MRGRIQIAGIIDLAEAQMLVEADVDDLAFPLGPGVHCQDLSEAEAAALIRLFPARSVLITYLSEARAILDFCRGLGAARVQLHADIAAQELAELKRMAPDIQVLKSLVVTGDNLDELEQQVAALSPFADAFITDTFDPETGARGATGKAHDWRISERLVAISPRPIVLAGGLTAENVGEAIRRVRPAGVDAHTGVEGTDGRKDRERVQRFVTEARRAFSSATRTPS